MKNTTLLYLLGIILTSCLINSCTTGSSNNEFVLDNAAKMPVSDIFRKDSVIAFLKVNGEANKDLSEQYLSKAEAVLDKDLNKSIYYFKRAITLYPLESYYIRYAKAMNTKEKYDDAAIAYNTAIDLNPSQSEDLYVEIIKNSLLSKEDYHMYTLLHNYKDYNYNLQPFEGIYEDEKIKNSVSPVKINDFRVAVHSIWGMTQEHEEANSEESKGGSFVDYLKNFDAVTFPLVVGKKELQHFMYDRSYDYEDYDPTTDFSRFSESSLFKNQYYSSTDYQYMIKQENGLSILIYAVDTSAEAVPAEFRCIYHRLIVFNNAEEVVDSKIIGVHAGEKLHTYKINPDLTIEVENFKRTWRKPFARNEIDNDVLSTEKTGGTRFKMTEAGKIVEEMPTVAQ